jgi:hypothetical protein
MTIEAASPVRVNWRTDNAEWLVLALERLRLRLSRYALWLQRPLPNGARTADWLVSANAAEAESRFHIGNPRSRALDQEIADVESRLAGLSTRMSEAGRPPALIALAELAGLSTFECDLLLLAAAPSIDGAFGGAFAELHCDRAMPFATMHLALGCLLATANDRLTAGDAISPGRPLRTLCLLNLDEDGGVPLLTRPLTVDERVSAYVRGLGSIDARLVPVLANLSSPAVGGTFDRVASEAAALVADRPERWSTVNLVGTVEGGARDMALAASAALGLQLLRLDLPRLAEFPPPDRLRLFARLGREALLGGVALLVDANGVERGGPLASLVDDVIERVAATLFVVSSERWPGDGEAHAEAHVVQVPRRRAQSSEVCGGAPLVSTRARSTARSTR